MNSGALSRWSVRSAGAVAVLILAGCSSTLPAGSAMMGGTSGVAAGSVQPGAGMLGGGSGMMGGGSEYHYSQLSCVAPASLPGSTVAVTLGDMGMTEMMGGVAPLGGHMNLRSSPTSVAGGQVSLVVSNMGWRTHEVVILPLASGVGAGKRIPGPDGKVDETGNLGEVSGSCAAGRGDGITAGSVGWATVTLAPGRYELLCNLENHYANGMYQEFDIT